MPSNILIPIKNQLYYLIRSIQKVKTLFSHIFLGDRAPYTNEIILVEPAKIRGHLEHKKRGWKNLYLKSGYSGGAVVGGDWDKKYITYLDLKEEEVYKSCYNHWVNGVPWEETSIYKGYVHMLESGIPNRFSSLEELSNRYRKLDKIFSSVKTSQKLSNKPEDMIRISIARDGTLIWGPDGRHRICMALCAGLEKIPVKIGYIHIDAIEQFQKYRVINSKKENLIKQI